MGIICEKRVVLICFLTKSNHHIVCSLLGDRDNKTSCCFSASCFTIASIRVPTCSLHISKHMKVLRQCSKKPYHYKSSGLIIPSSDLHLTSFACFKRLHKDEPT